MRIPRTSINKLTTGAQITTARTNQNDSQGLFRDNYPAAAAMKEAKTGCKHNGGVPCWDYCPFSDCQYSV